MITHGSLFSGIGGIDLGFEWAEINTVWQVEIDDYCQQLLKLRFPNAKRYKDIKEVGKHNLEKVDIISGGFPCQDISIAGKGTGIEGARSGLWSEMHRVISELRPRFAFIENVPMLTIRGGVRVIADLAEIGYDCEWQIVGANDIGAWHRRKRIWIVAYPRNGADKAKFRPKKKTESIQEKRRSPRCSRMLNGTSNDKEILANSKRLGCAEGAEIKRELGKQESHDKSNNRSETPKTMANANLNGKVGNQSKNGSRGGSFKDSKESPNSTEQRLERAESERELSRGTERLFTQCSTEWWSTEPDVGRVAHGIPSRVDRLKGVGNAVVPQIPYIIGLRLKELITTTGGK